MRPSTRVCSIKAFSKPLPPRKTRNYECIKSSSRSNSESSSLSRLQGASTALLAFCANIWSPSLTRKYSTVQHQQTKGQSNARELPRVYEKLPPTFFDAFKDEISSINLTELESPTLDLVDAEWGFPSLNHLKNRIREIAALHLFSTDEDHRRALEIWCMTALISSGSLSYSDCQNYMRTCIEVANPHLALKLAKFFSERGIRCNRHTPRLFFFNHYFKECVQSLKYVDKRDWEHTVESLAAITNMMETSRVRAFLLEGILRRFGERSISEQAMHFFILWIARVETLNQVGEYTRRWADLKLLSFRRLTALRLASLAFHRRFDEILELFNVLASQDLLGKDVFQPQDYKYVINGFLASRPSSLAPLVDHISAFSTIIKPTSTSLEPLIRALIESKDVATESERAANFTRAQALFAWLVAVKDLPSLDIWISMIRNVPKGQLAEFVPKILNHVASAAMLGLSPSSIQEIAKTILIQSEKLEESIDMTQLNEFVEKHQGDASVLWPNAFRALSAPEEKMEAINAAEAKYGDSGLPDSILSEAVGYLMSQGAYQKVFQLVQRALHGGRSLGEPSSPIWQHYITTCEILDHVEVIAEFVHPAEADYPGTTLAQRIQSFANMGRVDLLQDTLDNIPEHMRSNPLVQAVFQEVEFQLARVHSL